MTAARFLLSILSRAVLPVSQDLIVAGKRAGLKHVELGDEDAGIQGDVMNFL